MGRLVAVWFWRVGLRVFTAGQGRRLVEDLLSPEPIQQAIYVTVCIRLG